MYIIIMHSHWYNCHCIYSRKFSRGPIFTVNLWNKLDCTVCNEYTCLHLRKLNLRNGKDYVLNPSKISPLYSMYMYVMYMCIQWHVHVRVRACTCIYCTILLSCHFFLFLTRTTLSKLKLPSSQIHLRFQLGWSHKYIVHLHTCIICIAHACHVIVTWSSCAQFCWRGRDGGGQVKVTEFVD